MKKLFLLPWAFMILFTGFCQGQNRIHQPGEGSGNENDTIVKDISIKIPLLKGHRFVNNRLVGEPFIKTSLQMNVGVGSSNKISIPLFSIADTTLSISGSLIYANLIFNYEQRIKEWISFYFRAGLSLRIGADATGILLHGLNTLSVNNLGWKVRLFHNRIHYLTLHFGIGNYRASYTSIYNFVQSITSQNVGVSFTDKIPGLQGDIGLHYAIGFGTLAGLQLEIKYLYGDSFQKDKTVSQLSGAGTIDVNLYPKTRVPLAFGLGYGYKTLPEITNVQETLTSIYNFKISYTGSPDMLIAFDFSGNKNPIIFRDLKNNENIETFVKNFSLSMAYYFN